MYSYGSVRAGISDGSSSTDILHVNSGTECWIFPRRQYWHLDTTPPNIWDCVESYAIHMILTCRLKITFTSNLKLIISFLVLHIVLLSLFKSLSLVASTRHSHLTSHINLRSANRPSAQFTNSSTQGRPPSNGDQICPFSSQGRVLVVRVSCHGAYLEPKSDIAFFCNYSVDARKQENFYQRSTYEDQISTVPQQSSTFFFQEIDLLYSAATTRPTTMSLAKSVPDGLRAQECKWLRLCEPPLVSNVPVKDEVQEEVSKM